MQKPKRKKINKLTPSILYKAMIEYLLAFQNDFFNRFRNCPHCGSSNCKKHRIDRKKLFCKVIADGRFRDITVAVQVFYCNDCRKTYLAKSPFYEGIMYCQPVVDLCLYFSAKNPYHRVERIFLEPGIQVDRDTVKNYALRFEEIAAALCFPGDKRGSILSEFRKNNEGLTPPLLLLKEKNAVYS